MPITFTPTIVNNQFGAQETPMEGYEEIVAMGAAAFLLLEEGDPRGSELMMQFNAAIGREWQAKQGMDDGMVDPPKGTR